MTRQLDDAGRDVRHGLRALGRAPGFAIIALLTLALGIGAGTAMFTVVDQVLLRPLGFPEPDQLVMIQPSSGARLSPGYLHDWRDGSRAFRELAGWHDVRVNLTGQGTPREVMADRVTTNFFAMLGLPPALGRTFTAVPDLGRVEAEAILSHGFWQREFGGDPSIVGRTITLDGAPHAIVGVMPPGLTIRTTELAESRAEIWLPLALTSVNRTGMGGHLHLVGRLTAGVTPAQAQEELNLIARRIEAEFPSYSRDWRVLVLPLLDATVRDVRPILLVLAGAVGILLLMTCTNVAGLVLNRAIGRRTEFAIRLAVGASRGRVIRQVLTESLLLAAIGGLLGVMVAIWGVQALVSALPAGLELPRTGEIGIDPRVLIVGLVVTLTSGIVCGLVPAVSAARHAMVAASRAIVPGCAEGGRRYGVSQGLIVAQVALALVLLAGAGLLARSFVELTSVDPGFDGTQVLTLRTTLPATVYDTDARVRAFGDELLRRVHAVPGVRAAGSINYLPLSNTAGAQRFEIEGRPASGLDDQTFALTSLVGGRYFEAMGIGLIRGRLPTDADNAATEPVFVIDETLARLHWPDGDPVGSYLTWRVQKGTLTGPIIGVVERVQWTGLAAKPWPTAYFWFPHAPHRDITIVARTDGDPAALAASLADQVRALDPNQPIADVRVMHDLVAADLARPRFAMLVLAAFAAVALLLAAIGLYGVLWSAVQRRTREIGVRMALGAGRRDIFRLVAGHGMRLVGAGLLLGLAIALATGRLVSGLLFGITPSDAPTLGAVAGFLTIVACVAMFLPARRATRVDPTVALRAD